MISIHDLHKSFGKNAVLEGIDLKIDQPGIYAILGPNGSGKTTLIKTILGMVIPDKGRVEILGKNVRKDWKYRSQLNYLPQIANFPGNLKVVELLRMIKDLRGAASTEEELIERFGLEPFLDKKLSSLSGGTRQKVNIIIAFMFNSQLMILDEPSTGLDPNALLVLKEHLLEEKAKGKTILVTTHIMQFVEEMADEIIYLLEGNIYFKGSIEKLIKSTKQEDFQHAIALISKSPEHV